ncbi:hypothetical protein QNA08_03585 [Chelatococcus sp. SYSU_G07232]|uniref:Sulfur globule protein n=1 Tax=Chelatococcus albus TaxID=3047466 RepID=A0ABT7AD72_9HYPH|nr:hypothetical protein [Chelatococcus sp. SYSU_G07232]MDJ1157319.1 hypothetical protein [Chelatococcus sp. SYSU_G07232]
MFTSNLSKKTVATALAVLTVAGTLSVASTEAEARNRYSGGAVAAGVIGGLALGALAAGAARPAYAYPAPGYYYDYGPRPAYYGYGPAYYYDDDVPACFTKYRRVWVDGWGWRTRRVTVCD